MIAVGRIHALVAATAPYVSLTLVTLPEFDIIDIADDQPEGRAQGDAFT